jgi:hypothetical protein
MTATTTASVAQLSYKELAIVISASDMPTVRPQGVREDPAAYAAQGLALLGYGEVQRVADECQRLFQLKYFGPDRATRRAASGAHAQLWDGERRFTRAHVLAERLLRTAV